MVAPRGGAEACGWEPVMYGAIMRPDRRVLGSVHLLLAVRTPATGEALHWCCRIFSQRDTVCGWMYHISINI